MRRSAGEIGFSRVIVETTGLADPAPVLHTLAADAAVAASFRVGGVVTTVDAVNALSTLDRHAQARRQVSMADVLLLTKTNLAADETVAQIEARLARLNPAARALGVLDGRVDPALVLDAGSDGLAGMREDACEDDRAAAQDAGRRIAHLHHPHGDSIRVHSFCIDPPVPGAAFAHWLELLAAMRGERLLRLKGLVCVSEHPDEPLLVHGAQHVWGAIGLAYAAAAFFATRVFDGGTLRLIGEVLLAICMAQMWNLLAGYGGQLSLGHQLFVGIGAYTLFEATQRLGLPPYHVLPLAGAAAAALHSTAGRPAARRSSWRWIHSARTRPHSAGGDASRPGVPQCAGAALR